MRIRSPSLNELHAFAATARHRSFSRAAAELCVTQGAISRSIARLEERVGQPLLLRQGRRSEPTEAGLAYLQAIGPALEALEQAAAGLLARRPPDRLQVSVIPTLASKWLIPRLPDFQRAHPDVALAFAPYRRDDPLDDPATAAWIRVGRPPRPPGFTAEYVVGREIVPICRPEDLRGTTPIRGAADLLTRPLLRHTNYPDNWRHWFDSVGCPMSSSKAGAEFDQVAMLVQAVIAGLGVAVVPRCLVEDELAAGRVAVAVDAAVQTDRGYYLCYPLRRGADPGLKAFRDWLLGQARA